MITVKRTRRLSASYGTRLASFVIGERIPLIIKMTFFFRLDTSYNLSHVGRLPEYPQDDGANVDVSFYLTNPSTSAPVLQRVLASMLLVQISDLRNTLTQDVALRTSAAPGAPPAASSQQIENSVVIRISSFTANRVSASYPYSLPLRDIVPIYIAVIAHDKIRHPVSRLRRGGQEFVNKSIRINRGL